MSGAQYKKKIKPGVIELDPEQPTLIVNVTTQLLDLHSLTDDGQPTVVSTQQEQRRFKLKSFTAASNVSKFAAAFVNKCELIHESKTRHVEALLQQLADRMRQQEDGAGREADGDDWDGLIRQSSPSPPPSSSPTARELRLNSTAPLVSVSSPHASALSTTAPLAIHTRSGRSGNRGKADDGEDDEESKQPETPRTPLSPTSPAVDGRRGDRVRGRDSRREDRVDEEDDDGRKTKKKQKEEKTREKDSSAGSSRGNVRASPSSRQFTSRSDPWDEGGSPSSASASSSHSLSSPPPNKARSDSRNANAISPSKEQRRPPAAVLSRPPRSSSSSSASMSSLDAYVESLYDDLPAKVCASGCILELMLQPANLPLFVSSQHSSQVLEILSRVLGEERKKDSELVLNIVWCFHCLSQYRQLHPLVLSNHIGDMSMKVIALELKRYDMRRQDAQQQQQKQHRRFMQRQSELLYVCYALLLHLSEDVQIEMKMKERDLIRLLSKTLDRQAEEQQAADDELTAVVLSFLKKLSVFEENKQEMTRYELMRQLRPFLSLGLETAYRLLYNLTFDEQQRAEMTRCGYHQLCVEMLTRQPDRRLHAVIVRVLYSLSMDPQWRAEVAAACVPVAGLMVEQLLDTPGKTVDAELVALLINISAPSASSACASITLSADALQRLVKRLQQSLDPLLFKLLHHLAAHCPQLSEQCARYAADFVALSTRASTPDALHDSLGLIAASLCSADVGWSEILLQYNYPAFLHKQMLTAEDDIRLQLVRVVGVVCASEAAARKLKDSGIVRALLSHLGRSRDVDLTVQSLWTVYRLASWSSGRKAVCESEGAVELIAGLMSDRCLAVRELCSLCCDGLMHESDEWRETMKTLRFEKFNRRWLACLGISSASPANAAAGKAKAAATRGGDDTDDYLMNQRPKTAGKTKTLLRARNGRQRSRSTSPTGRDRSRSPSI